MTFLFNCSGEGRIPVTSGWGGKRPARKEKLRKFLNIMTPEKDIT